MHGFLLTLFTVILFSFFSTIFGIFVTSPSCHFKNTGPSFSNQCKKRVFKDNHMILMLSKSSPSRQLIIELESKLLMLMKEI